MYSDCLLAPGRLNPILFKIYLNKLFKAYVKALEYYENDYIREKK